MEERYISGEEHRAAMQNQPPPKQHWYKNPVMIVGLLIVALAAVFMGGYEYQKHHQTSATSSSNSAGMQSTGGGGGGDRAPLSGGPSSQQSQGLGGAPVAGSVTAVNEKSISIKTSSGDVQTFNITSSTEVLPGPNQAPQNYDPKNFQIGERVGIVAGGTDANMILPNYTN